MGTEGRNDSEDDQAGTEDPSMAAVGGEGCEGEEGDERDVWFGTGIVWDGG